MWLRKNARLAFEWDVLEYENEEPDRAEYSRLMKERRKHIDSKSNFVQYLWSFEQRAKQLVSFCITLFMVIIHRIRN